MRDMLAARQRNVAVRTAMPFLIAAGFTWLAGDAVRSLWGWAALYAAMQAGEYAFNRGLLADAAPTPSRAARAIVLLVLATSSIVFIMGAVLLLATRLTLAPSLSVLLAAGALLNTVVVSRRSRSAFLALNLPHFAWLMAMPVLMAIRMPHLTLAPAFGLGTALLCVSATLAWLNLSRALKAAVDARAEAEAARDSRAAFTAAVSHELRTPLSAVLAAASALEVRGLSAQDRQSAATISDAARLMRRLLDDLLDFSKLEAGRMSVEAAPFDLRALVQETVRLWRAAAEAKGLALEIDGAEGLPRAVAGDALRLQQVLNNLVSNAVKFTERGEVRLQAHAVAQAGGWRLRLRVDDTGCGLDLLLLDRLFRPFEQASDSVARLHGGTGLGLAISRELARLMGGELTAAARADTQGACFTLDIPLGEADALPEAPVAPAARDAAARILVVDDHPLGRQALATLLGLRGYDVQLCEGGLPALAMLAQARFDLVLSDLNMGDVGGREMTRRLRAGEGASAATPVLAVSGETEPAVRAACLAAGMQGLVAKPLDPRTLYLAVDAVLASSSATASLADSAASSFSSHSQIVSTLQPRASNAA